MPWCSNECKNIMVEQCSKSTLFAGRIHSMQHQSNLELSRCPTPRVRTCSRESITRGPPHERRVHITAASIVNDLPLTLLVNNPNAKNATCSQVRLRVATKQPWSQNSVHIYFWFPLHLSLSISLGVTPHSICSCLIEYPKQVKYNLYCQRPQTSRSDTTTTASCTRHTWSLPQPKEIPLYVSFFSPCRHHPPVEQALPPTWRTPFPKTWAPPRTLPASPQPLHESCWNWFRQHFCLWLLASSLPCRHRRCLKSTTETLILVWLKMLMHPWSVSRSCLGSGWKRWPTREGANGNNDEIVHSNIISGPTVRTRHL